MATTLRAYACSIAYCWFACSPASSHSHLIPMALNYFGETSSSEAGVTEASQQAASHETVQCNHRETVLPSLPVGAGPPTTHDLSASGFATGPSNKPCHGGRTTLGDGALATSLFQILPLSLSIFICVHQQQKQQHPLERSWMIGWEPSREKAGGQRAYAKPKLI
ncbi:hypothetical protein KQX54_007808 [Cotesia glomerata]|uniref:Secreted protein n=1 Tax=Cotesia glomerata TaxID=32391 RepID=A0AAV7J7J5_COTGL|nr:hypothetical protein KQX54_007808 [Cotesia glomerata]